MRGKVGGGRGEQGTVCFCEVLRLWRNFDLMEGGAWNSRALREVGFGYFYLYFYFYFIFIFSLLLELVCSYSLSTCL